MFKQKKIMAVLAPVGLLVGMAIATQAIAMSHGVNKYTSDGAKDMVTNSAGECWRSAQGTPGPQVACGDQIAEVDGDDDGDGVLNSVDRCPGTRAGAKVDQWGCEIIVNMTINLVSDEFDFDSAVLTPDAKSALDELSDRIKASKGQEALSITGYTDSTGPEDYNMGLSERRAQSAAAYLEGQGITGITTKGMGESDPVADNGTREGRAKNRRVEITTY